MTGSSSGESISSNPPGHTKCQQTSRIVTRSSVRVPDPDLGTNSASPAPTIATQQLLVIPLLKPPNPAGISMVNTAIPDPNTPDPADVISTTVVICDADVPLAPDTEIPLADNSIAGTAGGLAIRANLSLVSLQ